MSLVGCQLAVFGLDSYTEARQQTRAANLQLLFQIYGMLAELTIKSVK